MRGYVTVLHLRIPKSRRELDLLAFNENEFVIVDLQAYLGERGSRKKEARELVKRFKAYELGLCNTSPYSSLLRNKKLRRLFITEGNSDFKDLIADSGIEFMQMENFVREVLCEVKKYADLERWPFQTDDISRLLWQLISLGFIKKDQLV